jgi:hypothetical protein
MYKKKKLNTIAATAFLSLLALVFFLVSYSLTSTPALSYTPPTQPC